MELLKHTNKISIAVLPFVNMGPEGETEYFCDGITEEIINALAKIQQLKVISRTSSFYFKNSKIPLKEIGEQLDVSVILEGSVRSSGTMLRITGQLINVEDDSHFWSEVWDRDRGDIFAIQDEISLMIADKLREHLGHLEISDHLVEVPTRNLSAYDHYLKGRYHVNKWNPADAQIAIDQFENALALDSRLVEAHLGLADSYSFMAVAGFAPGDEAWAKAGESIMQAKSIDPQNAGLNYMLGNQAFYTKANYREALQYGLKSLARQPTFSEAHQFLAFLYTLSGNKKKSKEHLFYVKSIDPLSPETRFFEAFFQYRSGDHPNASSTLEKLIEENPKNMPALILSIHLKIKKGQYELAKEAYENIPDELLTPDERLGIGCLIEAASGEASPSRLIELEKNAEEDRAHYAHSYLFLIYSILGQNTKAFQILEKLFTAKSSILLLSFSDPLATPIQADPRYRDYHNRIYPELATKPSPKRAKARKMEEMDAQSFVDTLKECIHSESPFLDPDLSLRSLAEQINLHPNKLSWLLNEYFGKNFNEFINHFRVEHFKKLILDPSQAHISILSLAYDSGFSSKTAFNTTFKKAVGMTPKEFKQSQSQ